MQVVIRVLFFYPTEQTKDKQTNKQTQWNREHRIYKLPRICLLRTWRAVYKTKNNNNKLFYSLILHYW